MSLPPPVQPDPASSPPAAPDAPQPAEPVAAPHPGAVVAHRYFDPYKADEPGGGERTVYGVVVGVTSNTDDQGHQADTCVVAWFSDLAHGVPAAELEQVDELTAAAPAEPAPA